MGKIIKKILPALIILFCFFVSFSRPLIAETLTPIIEEVLVTAQMRVENVQTIPIAIGVYDKKFIERSGAVSLTDMETSIPNINFGRGDRNSRGEIAIRGIGDYSRNVGTDARVAVYIDGVLTGRSSSFDQGLLDVAHVEILRGPQGTLSGTNALAGAINIVTEKPNDNLAAELSTNAGNYGLKSITGKANLPITDDIFASLLIATARQEGYVYNSELDRDLQGVSRDLAKLKLRYVGSDALVLDVGFDYLNEDDKASNGEALADGAFNGFTLAPEPFMVAHDSDEYERRELKGATIEATYETRADYRWTSITGIRSSVFSELNEEDYSPLDMVRSLFDEKSDQVTQEFRLASPKGERGDYVIGTYFLNQEISTQRIASTGIDFSLAPNAFVTTPASAEVESASLYLHGNYYLSRHWTLTGGIRYVHETKNINYSSVDTIGVFVDVNQLVDQKKFDEWLPKLGVNFQMREDVLLYASVARGYKSGGWNADFLTTLEHFQFDPEYALNYELGIKSTFFDNRFTLNASGFVTKVDDFQVFQFIPTETSGAVLSLTNAGEVTTQGLEVDVKTMLMDGLTLTLNTAVTKAKFDDFKDGGGLGVDYDNNNLPYAPKYAYFAAFDYNKALSNQITMYGHINYGYTGNYFSNPNNMPDNFIASHYVTNVRLGATIGAYCDISLWIKNLTDETNLRQSSVSFLGVPRGLYNPPRTYGVTVNYRFE